MSHEAPSLHNPSTSIVHLNISITPNYTNFSSLTAFLTRCSRLTSISLSIHDAPITSVFSETRLRTPRMNQIQHLTLDSALFTSQETLNTLQVIFPSVRHLAFTDTRLMRRSGDMVGAIRPFENQLESLAIHVNDSPPMTMSAFEQVLDFENPPGLVIILLKQVHNLQVTTRCLFNMIKNSRSQTRVQIQIEHSNSCLNPELSCTCAAYENYQVVINEYMAFRQSMCWIAQIKITLVERFEVQWLKTIVFPNSGLPFDV